MENRVCSKQYFLAFTVLFKVIYILRFWQNCLKYCKYIFFMYFTKLSEVLPQNFQYLELIGIFVLHNRHLNVLIGS